MKTEQIDVLIVGAGLSGIGAGAHLKQHCPDQTFAILEGREAIGGTWDLFRYPGIRSDSDMYTLGYAFKPWTNAKAIADGPAILAYIDETAREHDLHRHVRLQHRVVRSSWSSQEARWLVDVEVGPERTLRQFSARFLYLCSGYYNYEQGHAPDFPGSADFKGRLVHPQHWPQDLDHSGQKVVVIGSGATAVTLVPSLAERAAKVTMLQRSPTYVLSRPGSDKLANWLNATLPIKLAYGITRWKNVLMQMLFYKLSRKRPDKMKQYILKGVAKALGPRKDLLKHFEPSYKPWDQRVCLVPDADLFKALRSGKADVVTDHIERFTATGVQLKSGAHLDADVIVTATGLDLLAFGGMDIVVDGQLVKPRRTFSYKGMMLSGVPNFAYAFGYTNASWTLKADLTSELVCKVLNHMRKTGQQTATPQAPADLKAEPLLDFQSGYVLRSLNRFPNQGDRLPWKMHQNYLLDLLAMRGNTVDDGVLVFGRLKR
jgi:monooxygenase